MGQYSEGWLTVPGIKDKRWRDSDGNYSRLRPGFGSQTLGATGVAIQNMFRGDKVRAFPNTFKDEYDADPSYPINEVVIEPSKKPKPDPELDPKPDPEITGPIPESTRTNKNRIVQTGINMSRSFNDLLNGVSQQPFGGSQLPTTMGNPYTATYKQTQGFGDEIPDIGGYNGVKFDSEGGRNAINSTNLQDQAPLSFSAPFIEGGSERIAQQATGITSGRLSDALNGVREQEAGREMTPERRQQMARAAFLNADGPMNGLKARDAVLGKVFAGGKYYISGESGDDQAIAIEDYQARDMNTGKTTANALLAEHIAKNKGNATPAESQAPPTIEKPGIKQSFGRTETISTPIDTSIPDTTAFNINNGVDVPAFGNKGGYKPMSKKSEVDYSSIFSY